MPENHEVSKLIVAYVSRILPVRNAADMYTFKYKGVWICLTILTRALAGNYVNFGVVELYGDRSLADALDVALRMILSIPLADLLKFRNNVLIIHGSRRGLKVLIENMLTQIFLSSIREEGHRKIPLSLKDRHYCLLKDDDGIPQFSRIIDFDSPPLGSRSGKR
nr:exportin-7-a [Quercus suber]